MNDGLVKFHCALACTDNLMVASSETLSRATPVPGVVPSIKIQNKVTLNVIVLAKRFLKSLVH